MNSVQKDMRTAHAHALRKSGVESFFFPFSFFLFFSFFFFFLWRKIKAESFGCLKSVSIVCSCGVAWLTLLKNAPEVKLFSPSPFFLVAFKPDHRSWPRKVWRSCRFARLWLQQQQLPRLPRRPSEEAGGERGGCPDAGGGDDGEGDGEGLRAARN